MGPWKRCEGRSRPRELGPALLHEHIFIVSPEGIENFNHAWGAPWWDEDARVAGCRGRAARGARAGIRTIVDPTAFGLSRNVRRIARVNEQVDLHIVVCTGVYAFMELPGFLKYRSADDLAALFIRELREGIDDTGIRAAFLKCAIEEHGVIGDIPVILDAIAAAALETGAPVMVHTNAEARTGLVGAGRAVTARASTRPRIVIAHAGDCNDMGYLRELAGSGAMLGLDRFNITFNTDEGRIGRCCACSRRGSSAAAPQPRRARPSATSSSTTRSSASAAGELSAHPRADPARAARRRRVARRRSTSCS